MSDIDLTEAVEAAARVEYERLWRYLDLTLTDGDTTTTWDESPSEHSKREWREYVRDYITAALPHIERQVREQVAREIKAQSGGSTLPQDVAYDTAAHIAREGT